MTEAEQPKSNFGYLLIIFLVALALRLIYLAEARRSPLLFFPGLDPQAYDAWAQRIAAGDWLGEKGFYQSPLYPYLLGAFYALFGRHLLLVYILQIFIGSLDCLVIYGIGNRVFGKRAGLLAGIFAAVYKPFIFYDSLLLKTFLEVFLIDLSLYLLLAASRSGKRTAGFLSGLALGLGSLARDNFIILILWFFPWLFSKLRKQGRASVSLYLLLGFCGIIGISAARNLILQRDFILTTSQAGQNFYIGNHRKNSTGAYFAPDFVKANPLFEEADFYREALKRTGKMYMKPSEVSNFWFKEAFKEIRADKKLFWERMALKFALFWNRKEIADNVSIYLFKKEFSVLLRMPLLDFGVAAPFGLLGMILALRKRKGILLAGYILIYWAAVSVFYIFARYRLAAVGPVLVFAGFAVENIYSRLKERNWKPLLAYLALLALFSTLVWWPFLKETLDIAYFNLGNSYSRAGKPRQAIVAYEKAIKENPSWPEFWTNLGKASELTGENGKAADAYLQAVRLEPDEAAAHLNLGIALYKIRYYQDAKAELQKALELNPNLKEVKKYLEMIEPKLRQTRGGAK